ncbi:hypothetical protein ACKOZB_004518 [Vibrio parahaemolyticus]|uniref:hypothetical protein n=1 Tax=Vibrio vulnificus TaxID=672 RepID=UPI00187D301E|nr:hypothetical protein [Vibrio vulnificus]EGQ8961636.1 hypothetical protein [Vibrio parahaemolyticus]EJG0180020.1 hypothetical protein [Vibrio parahaemolyticus]EJM9301964.1 hypothetical protein [Vibrio parahaemolyticus]HAS6594318.1 hypothetical protein [Vibrio parahaemolyticus]
MFTEIQIGESVASKADLFAESPHCEIVFPKELFGVVSLLSTTLFVPSGFSEKRFGTTLDLNEQKLN